MGQELRPSAAAGLEAGDSGGTPKITSLTSPIHPLLPKSPRGTLPARASPAGPFPTASERSESRPRQAGITGNTN